MQVFDALGRAHHPADLSDPLSRPSHQFRRVEDVQVWDRVFTGRNEMQVLAIRAENNSVHFIAVKEASLLPAGLDIPNSHGPVCAGGRQEPTVRAKRSGANHIGMPDQGRPFCGFLALVAQNRLPELHFRVESPAGQILSVWAELYKENIAFVTVQLRALFTGGHSPESHGFIRTTGCQYLAVWREGDPAHRAIVTLKDAMLFRVSVPNCRSPIIPYAGNHLSVRTEGDVVTGTRLLSAAIINGAQAVQRLTRGYVPDERETPFVTASHADAVLAEGDCPQLGRVAHKGPQFAPEVSIPKLHGVVTTGSGHLGSVRTERDIRDPTHMSIRAPNSYAFVPTGARQSRSVGAERNALDGIGVGRKVEQFAPGKWIPNLHAAVGAGGGEPAVFVESHGKHRISMRRQSG